MFMITEILTAVFWHNKVYEYLFIMLYITLGIWLIKVYQQSIINQVSRVMPDGIKQVLQKTGTSVITVFYLFMLYVYLQFLNLPGKADHIIDILAVIFFGISFIHIINNLILNYFINKYSQTNTYRMQLLNVRFFLTFSKIVIWVIGISVLIDNLGFKITPLIAGLGIGGVAVALASQVLLKDLFSCFAIYFDRPFNVGDFIVVDDFQGTVEHIGIKTTRLRSLGGEELVLANSDLTESRVRNYKRMQQRRILFNIKVAYDTPLEKLQLLPDGIRKIIKNIEGVTFDRAHLVSFNDYGFIFEIVYYVLSGDYNQYMDVQQQINFAIVAYFNIHHVSFAPLELKFFHSETAAR